MGVENWHEERDRLVRLLKAIESGQVTHVDEEDQRQLQAINPESVAAIRARIGTLSARIGDST